MSARILTGFQAALLASATSMAIVAPASAQDRVVSFDIPSQDLSSALRRFASVSNVDLLYSPKLVANRRSQAVKGALTPKAALQRLLTGTNLVYVETGPNVMSLRLAASSQVGQDAGNVSADSAPKSGPTAQVSGKVVDPVTGSALPGAKVTVVGTSLSTITNERGEFNFPAVVQGKQKLKFEYLGEDPQVVSLLVAPDRNNIVDFKLGKADADIVVIGQRTGTQKALNQQKNADNSVTIVSADHLGGFPAETISEALRRVPGVAFGLDDSTGEGSRITVRGFSSQAINIQMNGVDLQGAGLDRSVDLSGFLADNISQVTIHKTLLPSHEASGSGGLVEIETKSGLDYGEGQFSLNLEREQNLARGFGNEFQAGGVFAKRLTDNFGASATLQYRKTNRTNYEASQFYINPGVIPAGLTNAFGLPLDLQYPFDPEITPELLASAIYSFSNRDEESIAGSINLAWDVSDNTSLRFDYQRNENNTVGYNSGSTIGYLSSRTQLPIPELGGELRYRNYFGGFGPGVATGTTDYSKTYNIFSLRGETQANRFKFEYKVGYTTTTARGDNRSFDIRGFRTTNADLVNYVDPNTAIFHPDDDAAMTPRLVGGNFVTASNGVSIPSLTEAGYAYALAESTFYPFLATSFLDRKKSTTWLGELSARYEPASRVIEYLEVGGKYSDDVRDTNGFGTVGQQFVAGGNGLVLTPLTDLGGGFLTTQELGMIGLDGYSVPVISPAAQDDLWNAIAALQPRDDPATRRIAEGAFFLRDYQNWDQVLNDGENQIPTKTTEENISAYGEAKLVFGNLSVVGGVRYERDKRFSATVTTPIIALAIRGQTIDRQELFDAGLFDAYELGGTLETWTPSLLATWRPNSNIVARAGYFRSTVHPDFALTTASARWIVALRPGSETITLREANPDLKPTVTDNWDVDLAYYFTDAPGLVRVGFFHKKVSNNFTNVVSTAADVDVTDRYLDYFGPLFANYPELQTLPDLVPIAVTRPVNGKGGTIWGLEFEIDRRLTFLPGLLGDFGVIANATYTKGKFPTLINTFDENFQSHTLEVTRPLRDQPKWVYNLGLDYQRGGFQGRVIYTHQDATANAYDWYDRNTVLPAYSTLDARFSYTFKQFGGLMTLFVEGDDLLRGSKDPLVRSVTSSQFGTRDADFSYPNRFQFLGGRSITVGLRSRF